MSWLKNPALNKKGQLLHRQPDRTKQAMAAETDINRIVSTFMRTGALPVSNRVPMYGDATTLPILQDALAAQRHAVDRYNLLPDLVRKETGGDYRRLEGWLSDPRNTQTAINLGLLTPPLKAEAPAPPKAQQEPPQQGGKGDVIPPK